MAFTPVAAAAHTRTYELQLSGDTYKHRSKYIQSKTTTAVNERRNSATIAHTAG